jgi:hypothetical protein
MISKSYKLPHDTSNVDHLIEYAETVASLRRLAINHQNTELDKRRATKTRAYLLDKCGKIDIHLSSKDLMKAQLYALRKCRSNLDVIKALHPCQTPST